MKKTKPKISSKTTQAVFKSQYMVWAEGRSAPTMRFLDLEEARKEAERICDRERVPVYVLADILRCSRAELPVSWQNGVAL